jgi:hypothetical protein
MEETGIKTTYQGIIGFREMLDARYTASDLYIVCLMTCPDSTSCQEINIIDKREIFQAKWVSLAELSSNEEGEARYRMFPNAWKFVKYLNQRLLLAKEKKLCSLAPECGTAEHLTATQLIKQVTLTRDEVQSKSGHTWGYYISEALKFAPASDN